MRGATADHERSENLCILACSATPNEIRVGCEISCGSGWEFLSAGSRVSPFERMFVACLLLRDGATQLTYFAFKPLVAFQKLGSVPKASHIQG
jgi:hypothetical protein